MSNTNTQTEAIAVQDARTKSFWEKLGVEFRKSASIAFAMNGEHGEPTFTWGAWYKGSYLTGGCRSFENLINYMSEKSERYTAIIAKMDSKK